jgi:hypothetical protein
MDLLNVCIFVGYKKWGAGAYGPCRVWAEPKVYGKTMVKHRYEKIMNRT